MSGSASSYMSLLLATLMCSATVFAAPKLDYADITIDVEKNNGNEAQKSSFTGVYAVYGPVGTMKGNVVLANPFDGCNANPIPDQDEPFILMTRLTKDSNCSYLDLSRKAAELGASGLINMAASDSQYIYLLELTPEQKARGEKGPDMPSASISGLKGTFILEVMNDGFSVTLEATSPDNHGFSPFVVDLTISLICITVAGLLLIAVFHAARYFWVVSVRRRTARERDRMITQLLAGMPVSEFKRTSEPIEDPCAVCLEPFEAVCFLRTLPCKHVFHRDCIDPWITEHYTCPLCKYDVSQPDGVSPADRAAREESTRARQQQQHEHSLRARHGSDADSEDGDSNSRTNLLAPSGRYISITGVDMNSSSTDIGGDDEPARARTPVDEILDRLQSAVSEGALTLEMQPAQSEENLLGSNASVTPYEYASSTSSASDDDMLQLHSPSKEHLMLMER